MPVQLQHSANTYLAGNTSNVTTQWYISYRSVATDSGRGHNSGYQSGQHLQSRSSSSTQTKLCPVRLRHSLLSATVLAPPPFNSLCCPAPSTTTSPPCGSQQSLLWGLLQGQGLSRHQTGQMPQALNVQSLYWGQFFKESFSLRQIVRLQLKSLKCPKSGIKLDSGRYTSIASY